MTRTLLQLAETAAVFAACLVVAAVTKPPTREEREARDFRLWSRELANPPLILPGPTLLQGVAGLVDGLNAAMEEAGEVDE